MSRATQEYQASSSASWHLEVLPPLPPVRICPDFSASTATSPIATGRCTSEGVDLGAKDIAQQVFEAVTIAIQWVLVENELVSSQNHKPEFCQRDSATIYVVAQFSSSQEKLAHNCEYMYWRQRDMNMPESESPTSSGSETNPWVGLS